MRTKDFMVLVEKRFEHCRKLLGGSKDLEYSRNGDKLWNFKAAAAITRQTSEKALLGMWTKHLVSVLDIIDDLDNNIIPTQETINEKVGDNINYLLLLEGLIKERRMDEC